MSPNREYILKINSYINKEENSWRQYESFVVKQFNGLDWAERINSDEKINSERINYTTDKGKYIVDILITTTLLENLAISKETVINSIMNLFEFKE